jgi:alpha/beta superfamily hydrolase
VEERIRFRAGDLCLEGLWRPKAGAPVAVITHPHPLYGGDMHNPVVTSITDSFMRKGYATLRFNFRGTGASEGGFDDGLGERQDLLAALEWVHQQTKAPICVAGYSFGAWVAAGAAAAGQIGKSPLFLVSPPVAFLTFAEVGPPLAIEAVVVGRRDDFAPLPQVKTLLARWQASATLAVIEDCDHFYSHHLAQLEAALADRIPTDASGSTPCPAAGSLDN